MKKNKLILYIVVAGGIYLALVLRKAVTFRSKWAAAGGTPIPLGQAIQGSLNPLTILDTSMIKGATSSGSDPSDPSDYQYES